MQVKYSRRRFLALLASVPVLGGLFVSKQNKGVAVSVQTAPVIQTAQTDFDLSSALQRVTNPSLVGQKYLEHPLQTHIGGKTACRH